MVEFMYMADFPFVRAGEFTGARTTHFVKERMFHFAKLCIVADKYEVTGLEAMACKQFRGCLQNKSTSSWRRWSPCSVMPTEDDVVELGEFVYTKRREGAEVRSALVESLLPRDSTSLISHLAFEDMLKAKPDLLFDLFKGLVGETNSDSHSEKLLVSVSRRHRSFNGRANTETIKAVRPYKRDSIFDVGDSVAIQDSVRVLSAGYDGRSPFSDERRSRYGDSWGNNGGGWGS